MCDRIPSGLLNKWIEDFEKKYGKAVSHDDFRRKIDYLRQRTKQWLKKKKP